LPSTLEYPRDDENRLYTFFAQLNLAELNPHQDFLPRQGWLYFFAEEEEQFSHPRVLYFPGPLSSLEPFQPQPEDRFADSDREAPYPACRVEIGSDWSLPNLYGCSSYGQGRFGPDYPHFLELEEQSYRQEPDPYEQLSYGRHPQQNTHVLNGYVFTQNESPEEQACQSLLGEAQEWCNLLSLGSDLNTGFCFWDAGTITFSVHKKDLAIGEFSRVHLSLESS
jgi:uncharacterized protein YwqG